MRRLMVGLPAALAGLLFGCRSENGVTPSIRYEAEEYQSSVGAARIESKPSASGGKAVHIGPDLPDPSQGVGDALVYEIVIKPAMEMGVLELHYADDVAGNVLNITCDGALKGSVRTERTGGWDQFVLDSQKVDLGRLSEGRHSLRFELARGGSYGVLLDFFALVSVLDPTARTSRAYGYVRDLANPQTGLVGSADYDAHFTTVYKNALAAMAFLHEGDTALAERVFDFFLARYRPDGFDGFNKNWDPQSGVELERDHWVGDNAFLLLALNYYEDKTGSYGRYQPMVDGIVRWLSQRADDDIIAEGLANMYAALKPFESTDPGMPTVLRKLRDGFFAKKDYANVLDHIERGALCFSDISGFVSLPRFRRRETWEYNRRPIDALAAFAGDGFSNIEITAQVLLAAKIWRSELSFDLSDVEAEMNKLWLTTGHTPGVVNNGLPYFLTRGTHGWEGGADESIIDPACYMLFHEWGFNPMAPGRRGY